MYQLCVCVCVCMKNAQLLIQMEIIYTLDTDLLDAAAAKTTTGTTGNGSHMHTHTHAYANVNTCAYVCVVYVGLLISFLLGYVLCEITQVQPTVIFVEVCFVSVPKAIFYCLSLSISLYPPLLHFLIIVFIVFTLSYVCNTSLCCNLFVLIFFNIFYICHDILLHFYTFHLFVA